MISILRRHGLEEAFHRISRNLATGAREVVIKGVDGPGELDEGVGHRRLLQPVREALAVFHPAERINRAVE